MATIVAVTPALAGHTGPLVAPQISGQSTNYDCADLVTHEFIDGYDDEDKSGSSPSGNVDLEHVSFTATGSLVSFQADPGWLVAAVNVKGGNQGGNIYVYDGFPGGGVDHDNNLVTADNSPGNPAGISHLVFCLITDESPPEISLFLVPCEPGQQTAPRIRVVALVLLGLHLFLDGQEIALDGNGEAAVAAGTYDWSVENDDEVELASGEITVAPCTTSTSPGGSPEGTQAGGSGTPAGSLADTATVDGQLRRPGGDHGVRPHPARLPRCAGLRQRVRGPPPQLTARNVRPPDQPGA